MERGIVSKIMGALLSVFLLVVVGVFIYLLLKLDMLPTNIFSIVGIIILGLAILSCLMQFTRAHAAASVMAVLMSVVLCVGCLYINKTYHVFSRMHSTMTESFSVVSLKEYDKNSISECKDGLFGFNDKIRSSRQLDAINKVSEAVDEQLGLVPYDDWFDMVDALYNGGVDTIILNEAYRGVIEEEYPDFAEKTKVLGTQEYQKPQNVSINDVEVLREPFIVYLAANDNYGTLTTQGRNDVNIIAVVNPVSQKVLLVTIPRDAYVTLRFEDNSYSGYGDKLTHAGTYGIQTSMNTIEDMFDIQMNYYMKINFSGMINLVDALNGITVESDYEFTTYDGTHHFVKGTNKLNGLDAMYFARERYAFADGDFQRSRDQIKVINAIIDKALSPVILTNYLEIMNSMEKTFDTNVPYQDIADLVKFQLDQNPQWEIESMNITGSTGWEYCYTMGQKNELSVVYPDANQIKQAKSLIDMYMNKRQ